MRSFEVWKAQLQAFLLSLQRDDPDFEVQKKALVIKLGELRSRWLATFLRDLYLFAEHWQIDLKQFYPTPEEVAEWMTK